MIGRCAAVYSALFLLICASTAAEHSLGTAALVSTVLAADFTWEQVPADKQQLLQHHASGWNDYKPTYRKRLLNGVDLFLQMSPDERLRIQQRALRFQHLPPERRQWLCRQFFHEKGYLPTSCK
ncbi:MAG: DUF3106 domain-containing protein [Gammaproteobacteria bacterium]|nr:DUF3106 domain-containing protein [Gammaproteobacteria bacterium]